MVERNTHCDFNLEKILSALTRTENGTQVITNDDFELVKEFPEIFRFVVWIMSEDDQKDVMYSVFWSDCDKEVALSLCMTIRSL